MSTGIRSYEVGARVARLGALTVRSRGAAAVALAAMATMVASSPVVPLAHAGCANEALREGQHSTFLPDCRAFEMVSPADKNGGEVMGDPTRTRSASDGSAVELASLTAFGDAMGTAVATEYMAERSSDPSVSGGGWTTHAITPLLEQLSPNVVTSSYEPDYAALSGDLSKGVFRSWGPLTEEPLVEAAPNVYTRTNLGEAGRGSYTLMSWCPLCAETQTPLAPVVHSSYAGYPAVVGASADFGRVLFESTLRLTSDANGSQTAGVDDVYASDGVTTRLVDRVPVSGSECVEPECVVPSAGAVAGRGTASVTREADGYTPHVLSADGSQAIFSTEGKLYLRDLGSSPERTVQVNASERTDCADHNPCTGEPEPAAPQAAIYWDASADGSRVFFTSGEPLTGAPGSGLYMYEPAKPAGHRLTLIVQNGEELIGASEDGHYVYFVSSAQLVSGGPPLGYGGTGLFMWSDGPGAPAAGQLRYIGELAGFGQALRVKDIVSPNRPRRQARVSADGRHLVFISNTGANLLSLYGGTDYDQEHCAAGEQGDCDEVYVYDADSNRLRCASCRPDGVPASVDASTQTLAGTGATSGTTYENRAVSRDGRFVFFSTAEPLVSADINGVSDAYEYDTTTGEVHLLSSGQSPESSYFMDATPDGSNAFVLTRERLVGWDVDRAYDLYDVRAAGGFPEPPPLPPSCEGDACQPPPVSLIDATPGTITFSGPGSTVSDAAGTVHRHVAAKHAKRKRRSRHRKHRTHRTATHRQKGKK